MTFTAYAWFPQMLINTDARNLAELQCNAQLAAKDLGEALNLSASQAGRRRLRLEAGCYIIGYTARLDPVRIGLNVPAFVQVQMATHSPEAVRSFASLISTRTEVKSAWTLTGEADYLLRVCCSDLPALNLLIHQVLLPHPAVARAQSQIVMDQFKAEAPLPT